jgi:hypothetical protein
MDKFKHAPTAAFSNIANVWGGSIKADGSVEMNSGTLNDIISADPLTGKTGVPVDGPRSRPELIPEVVAILNGEVGSIVWVA